MASFLTSTRPILVLLCTNGLLSKSLYILGIRHDTKQGICSCLDAPDCFSMDLTAMNNLRRLFGFGYNKTC